MFQLRTPSGRANRATSDSKPGVMALGRSGSAVRIGENATRCIERHGSVAVDAADRGPVACSRPTPGSSVRVENEGYRPPIYDRTDPGLAAERRTVIGCDFIDAEVRRPGQVIITRADPTGVRHRPRRQQRPSLSKRGNHINASNECDGRTNPPATTNPLTRHYRTTPRGTPRNQQTAERAEQL